MNYKQRIRARFVFVLIVVATCGIGSSLYWTQVINGPSYAVRAEKQYAKPSTSLFDRGSIFFESKDTTRAAAATIGSGYVVYMNPLLITDAEQEYQALSQYIKLNKVDFLARAQRPHDSYEELAHKIDEKTALSIRGLGLAGIGIIKETWRSYPGGELASHTLGIIGESKDGSIEGKYGLERTYQDILDRPPINSGTTGFAQLFSSVQDVLSNKDNTQGDIVTTIDPAVQGYVESIISKTNDTWKPDEIGAIVIDPSTGEIRAMVSLPTFNPNDLTHIKNINILSNPLVEDSYEMGSIIKPLTIATGLDTGSITTTSTYDDTGTMTLNGKKFSNYDGKARGIIPVQEILSQSLNIGAATIALKVDKDSGKGTFATYFSNFGLGQKSGIDQPNESTGLISSMKSVRDIETATASYGQGIAMSPITTARALSVLANGGYLVTPHIVKEIDYVDGTIKTIPIKKIGPLLKKQTIDDVTRMLVTVVDKKMVQLHPGIYNEHHSVAAKTGTAQIADHVNGGYYKDRYLHSFFGYFPAYNPKYLIFLYQIYPKGAQYASETLTEPFSEIQKFLVNYYNITPDR